MSLDLDKTHFLYRMWADDQQLLYVGITRVPTARTKQHAKTAGWWKKVAKITMLSYPDKAAALEAELEAIRLERPLFNVAGSLTPPKLCWICGNRGIPDRGDCERCDKDEDRELALRWDRGRTPGGTSRARSAGLNLVPLDMERPVRDALTTNVESVDRDELFEHQLAELNERCGHNHVARYHNGFVQYSSAWCDEWAKLVADQRSRRRYRKGTP